ncbi:MAG: response regulator transcription factor [Jatrophihabitantaceae bacterium]
MHHIQPGVVRAAMIDSDAILVDVLARHCAHLIDAIHVSRMDPDDPDLLRGLLQTQPDVATMDPEQVPDAAQLIAAIHEAAPNTAVIVLTQSQDPALSGRLAQAGAVGWVDKTARAVDLVEALRAVCRGEASFPPHHLAAVMRSVLSGRAGTRDAVPVLDRRAVDRYLSEREREVLSCVLAGSSSRSIARDLHLSESTVRSYRRRIVVKLGF